MIVMAPISVGELIDKITILEIKLDVIDDANKRDNIHKELDQLNSILEKLELPNINMLRNELKNINCQLWTIEDEKRDHERDQDFDAEFIELARQVYIKNDRRASIKRQINYDCGSDIIEEKSHRTVT